MPEPEPDRTTSVYLHGILVTITLGVDGVPVVFVDNDRDFPENEHGPIMRVRLNDHPLHLNPPVLEHYGIEVPDTET